MPIEGTVSKEGDLYKDFTAGILTPGKDKHFLSPFELRMKKLLAKLKKEKMTPKGGKKYKRNIKMARKFRNKRRRGGVFATRVQFLSNDEKKQIKEAMDAIGKDNAYGETSNALRQRIMDKINPRNANPFTILSDIFLYFFFNIYSKP